ncbi:Sulfurtransferase [Strongyloides ratti]|uniref:Sulfurtransferase n=1 Tax=Strongyloides ratti TaxID=34506 RepID=A0A090MZM9_STRRB|nr:Sulfurtransferase [Strongyloides ratti]CEF69214.1 Sulfurtransferase [Strongyloides ratti]
MHILDLKKVLSTKCLNEIITNGGPKINGVKILDCTYSVTPKPNWEKFQMNELGQFNKLMEKSSKHKQDYLTSHIPHGTFFDFDCAMFPGRYERFSFYQPELFEIYAKKLGINRYEHLVFYSRGPYNGALFAAKAFRLFKCYGHENMSILDGGFDKWCKDGFKIESGTNDENNEIGNWSGSDNFSINVKYSELVKKNDDEKDMFEDLSKTIFLDARSENVYNGQTETGLNPYFVDGCYIPGTINLPATEFFNSDGTFKDELEIKNILNKKNIDIVDVDGKQKKEVVTFCNTGTQATILNFVLEHIYPKVKTRLWNGGLKELEVRNPKRISGKAV